MLDLRTYAHCRPVVVAIIRHENGRQPYGSDVIDEAPVLAGIARGEA